MEEFSYVIDEKDYVRLQFKNRRKIKFMKQRVKYKVTVILIILILKSFFYQ